MICPLFNLQKSLKNEKGGEVVGLKMGRFTSSQCSARTWIVSDGNMSFVQWWSVAYVSGGPANIDELTGCFTS